MIAVIYQNQNLRMGYLTRQMTLNSSASVFEEMSKPFEHLKMELLIREETNWLVIMHLTTIPKNINNIWNAMNL